MRRMGVLTAAVSLLTLAASAQTEVLFKQKVKIPFALQYSSDIVKPGEYTVVVKVVAGGRKLLTLSSGNKEVLRAHGEYADVPKSDRDFKKQSRLQLMRIPSETPESDGAIVFNYDWKVPGGQFRRLTFEVPEAAKKE